MLEHVVILKMSSLIVMEYASYGRTVDTFAEL